MTDYRAMHLPHDLPPSVETPDLPGAGGPAPSGKPTKRPEPEAPVRHEKPAQKPAGESGATRDGDA
jgi:hypothetical protein